MRLIFVHGWSVTHTETYGKLPQALAAAASGANLTLDIQHIYLGRYISFHDEVTVDDIARALNKALIDLPGNNADLITPFSCITHSTGGPVVRHWVEKYYGAERLGELPLTNLVMLAPANHGSALAKLGKSRVGRMKSWFAGVEPGQRVLDWLALGSDGQWSLNQQYTAYTLGDHSFFPFVLTGQKIDEQFYDFINSYLVEKGSDGVVRVAGANLNHRYFTLKQGRDAVDDAENPYPLQAHDEVRSSPKTALGVYGNHSHTGEDIGIMQSIKANDTNAPVVQDILKCLSVKNNDDYQTRVSELARLTKMEQSGGDVYCALVFNVRDDEGEQVAKDNYDLLILVGDDYEPSALPKGFFQDRQMNDKTGRLVYYLNASKMNEIGKFGFRVNARPSEGFASYKDTEFHSGDISIQDILAPNETTYVDIELHRFVDENVFRFGPVKDDPESFRKTKPSGNTI